jgi:hypothetical protein
MAGTQVWRASPRCAAAGRPLAASPGGRRAALRLWTLLHAQGLLQGTVAGPGGVAVAEDDRWRLAARRPD